MKRCTVLAIGGAATHVALSFASERRRNPQTRHADPIHFHHTQHLPTQPCICEIHFHVGWARSVSLTDTKGKFISIQYIPSYIQWASLFRAALKYLVSRPLSRLLASQSHLSPVLFPSPLRLLLVTCDQLSSIRKDMIQANLRLRPASRIISVVRLLVLSCRLGIGWVAIGKGTPRLGLWTGCAHSAPISRIHVRLLDDLPSGVDVKWSTM